MKNKTSLNQQLSLTVAAGLLVVSPFASSVTYEPSELGQNNMSEIGQSGEFSGGDLSSPSFLESYQKSEVDIKKSNYLETLNLLKDNKLKEAKAKISQLLKDNPKVPEYYNLQALSEILEKKPQAAEQSYQKALSIDPSNILSLLGLAQIKIAAGNYDQAKTYANKALSINSNNLNAYRLLATIASSQKNYDEYEKVLLTVLDKVGSNIALEKVIVSDLVKLYGIQKKPEKGLSISEELVKRHPNNGQALSMLAFAQIVANKKDLAENTLRQVMQLEKQDVASRLALVQLLAGQADKEKEVLQWLDEAMALDPKNVQAITLKTAYLTQLKRYPEALDLADKADKQFPDLALGKALKGSVYLAERKFDQALGSYRQAYQKRPNDKLLFVIVDLMNAQNQQKEAIGLLDKALQKAPNNNAVHFKLAEAYQSLNEVAKAEQHYQAVLAAQPDNVLVLNNLAWLYAQQNNPKALELAKKAYDKAPKSAAIVDTYGYVLVKQGKPAEGLAQLEKAAGLAPKANDIQFHLAEAYVANNNKGKAIAILETITKAEQNFPEKKAAAELLAKLKAN